MNKHAYLILAHNQPEILEILLKELDIKENDIYIHLDVKSDISKDHLKTIVKNASLFFTERLSIQWGGYSIVEATLNLLEQALKTEHIYYHFLSGVDLPLRDIGTINKFYEENIGKQFIRFFSEEKAKTEYDSRFGYKSYFRDKFGRTRNMWAILNRIGLTLQKGLHIYDDRLKNCFHIGSQFWDITEELASDLVNNRARFKKLYKYTSCSDEIFVQTYIYGTKYMNDLWIPYDCEGNGMESNKRYIDFTDEYKGSPHTIIETDIDKLVKSGLNFARKFDKKNIEAIELLYSKRGESLNLGDSR